MFKLPQTTDFDETQFPSLQHIFRDIDTAIAAIVASDPTFRGAPTSKRRSRGSGANAPASKRLRNTKRAAA